MNTLIITACVNYPDYIKDRFIKSLNSTKYRGDLVILEWDNNSGDFYKKRIKEYYEKIKSLKDRYKTIITTDIRDVVFQNNPENIQHSDLDFFLEDESVTIKTSTINAVWIESGFGKDCLNKIGDNYISCAGVVIGNSENMFSYYKKMFEISSTKNVNDQGLHNFLIYTGQIKAKLIRNEESEVYTVGYVKDLIIKNHIVYNKKGNIPAIVHQYDRHVSEL
jgi:hypothetical protein